jgi:hypothetical protein
MASHTGHRSALAGWMLSLNMVLNEGRQTDSFGFFSIDDLPKKRPAQIYKPSNPDTLAYLDFSVSTTGMLAGVKVRSGLVSADRLCMVVSSCSYV